MKAQISTEFMFMIMSATAMIVIFMFVFSEMYQDNLRDKKRILATDFGYSLQTELMLAAESKHGYTRYLDIPAKLEGYQYDLIILSSTLIINYSDGSYAFQIPSVIGNFTKGSNVITNQNNTICINC